MQNINTRQETLNQVQYDVLPNSEPTVQECDPASSAGQAATLYQLMLWKRNYEPPPDRTGRERGNRRCLPVPNARYKQIKNAVVRSGGLCPKDSFGEIHKPGSKLFPSQHFLQLLLLKINTRDAWLSRNVSPTILCLAEGIAAFTKTICFRQCFLFTKILHCSICIL